MKKDLNNLTIRSAAEILASGEITSVQLTEYYLNRIKEINPKINAFITVLDDIAIEMAKMADKRRKEGKTLSDLNGIPIAIKDNMAMEGTLTTAASHILEGFIAPYDATVISKLKAAGVVIIGKTNLDEFAMGSSTENSYYGVTKNPYDTERVAGGSSGGSAAAVAADMCVAALGSDTGGSIRQPASFCGVCGFKPTYGMVSRYGLLAMASSLDQIGPITKTAEDARIIYNIITGKDEKDSTSINQNSKLKIKNDNLKFKIENLKIGIPKEYFGEGLDTKVKKIIIDSIDTLKKLGAEIIEISLPNSKYALSCYYIIMPVEVSSNLARYDGIRYGYSEIQNSKHEIRNLMEIYLKSRATGFGDEAKRRIMLGTYASSKGYIGKFYNKAQKVRSLIKKDFDEAFEKVDFILGPVTPEVVFKIGAKTQDPLKMYLSDIYTIAVNLAGLPAISVPAGISDELPVGLHLIGNRFSDHDLLSLANIFEGEQDELSRAKV